MFKGKRQRGRKVEQRDGRVARKPRAWQKEGGKICATRGRDTAWDVMRMNRPQGTCCMERGKETGE